MEWTQALTIIATTLGTTIGFYILLRSDINRLDDKWESKFLAVDEKFLAMDEKWESRFLAMDEKWERLFDRLFIKERVKKGK